MSRVSERLVRIASDRDGVEIIGAYDPELVGGESGDFFDATHLREVTVQSTLDERSDLFSKILPGTARAHRAGE